MAIADVGRDGEIRFLGAIDSAPATVERVIGKLACRYEKLHVCYEAGPTGYGLYRQVRALGHDCTVVAPSLIPRKPGERVKTRRSSDLRGLCGTRRVRARRDLRADTCGPQGCSRSRPERWPTAQDDRLEDSYGDGCHGRP